MTEYNSSPDEEKPTSRPANPLRKKPLSPALGIYRWEVTMVLSILHRLTGVFLWLVAVVALLLVSNQLLFHFFPDGDNIFSPFVAAGLALAKRFFYIVLAPIFFALFFHGLNGLRHFFWDIGWGYDIKVARLSAWLVISLSLLLTILMVIMMWRMNS